MAASEAPRRTIGTAQAAFIGVAAMVGAGIFSLLGAAGEVAGAAVWLSFLLAGAIAALQGYSFARLGARIAVLSRKPEQDKDVHRFQLPSLARDMDLHPDGLRVAAAHHDRHVRITRLAANA